MIRPPYQWQVVRAVLDPVVGSEQAGERPVLIVSSETCNPVLPNVTVVPLTTHRSGTKVYWNEVLIPAGAAGQPADSVAMVHQVRTMSKRRLLSAYGHLMDPVLRERVQEALRLYFDLD